MADTTLTRLNKYISESGVCSRREADKYIEQGNVLVNGKKAKIGDQVSSKDRVVVNGNLIEPRAAEDAIYIAFNKPPGITSTTETSVKDNIIRYIKHSERIFPIGRLDKDSQGLILLTSNGDIVNKILRAGNKHEKEYIVMVDKPITSQFIEGMRGGVPIMGIMTQKCEVQKETNYIFRITLIQGMNRQIRRMCEHFGYEVVQLERIRVMNISVKGLGVGDWRELTEKELADLMAMTEHSTGTKEASLPKQRVSRTHDFWKDKRTRPDEENAEKPARKSGSRGEKSSGKSEGIYPKSARKPAGKPRSAAGQTPAGEGKPFKKPAGRTGSPRAAGSASGKSAARPPRSQPQTKGRSRSTKR
ncbi:23S rRNA pseudouridine(2604) synthase RluF [Hymenobacter jejuensis]|uniref:Pseudouridine synthase n=1 Tax=Hymenobacter jejuensis TaxID=2502781 RepID=A0A5B7ZWH0_9BACT|nr:23S rRNA pseudouridine(2604) synthase RluF [Hymenobacter jejuensis]QDA58853.1 23S rRNA pseudouridine(2604) synthase RluF [Hymenobacter jejuensis]